MKRPKISIVIAVWGTEHLLKRSIFTYAKQDFPKDDWELIVVDDNALGDVRDIIYPYRDKINMQYIRFEHPFGMRGNTVSFNTAFMCCRGDIIAESTPETMWQPNVVRTLYEKHEEQERRFVAMKTYNLESSVQLKIDSVDWHSDINNIQTIEGFRSAWTLNNEARTVFGTHQTCSIRKKVFYEVMDHYGFPLFCGYGEDDPYYADKRRKAKVEDYVVMDTMPIHQWHLPFDFFAAYGNAPMLNKYNHTIENYMNDITGEVPPNGTCGIFDHGDNTMMDEDKRKEWEKFAHLFHQTGGDIKYLKR